MIIKQSAFSIQHSAVSNQQSTVSRQRSAIKLFLFSFILFTFHFSLFTSASAEHVDEVVGKIQKKLSSVSDIRGSFVQTSFIKDLEETQEYAGTFFIKKPDQMMWQYAEPRDEKVVIRDTDTWIYKKSEKQVIKTKFNKESYSHVPIAMLGSLDNIRDDFDITIPGKNALQLVPKQKKGYIKKIVMETVPEGFPLKMFTILDTYGNIIMIDLKNVQINPGLEDAIFIFNIPQGVEVFDMSR